MTDKPIIFSASMVRALLEGRKTQTRRILKPAHAAWLDRSAPDIIGEWDKRPMPYKVGDRLWVRETWAKTIDVGVGEGEEPEDWPQRPCLRLGCTPQEAIIWRADGEFQWCDGDGFATKKSCWRSPIHMPREASRILLEVTEVRVERVQAISDADAIAEGLQPVTAPNGHVTYQIPGELGGQSPRRAFRLLWEGINGTGSWNANPWVWAISFKVLSAPGWRAAA